LWYYTWSPFLGDTPLEVIPLQNLTKDIICCLHKSNIKLTTFHKTLWTVVHKDNTGVLNVATMEPGGMNPRSKHYGIKYHWFRQKVKPNKIEITHVRTLLQRANSLTKSLWITLFEYNWKLTCGWWPILISSLERECWDIHIWVYLRANVWQ
jgi:hypothetical protein